TVDTMKVIGSTSAETYHIYAMTAGQNSGLAALLGTTFAAGTEIVITRTVGGVQSVVAELDNIEEIVINGQGGGDTFVPVGNFGATSLLTSTITLEGTEGDDVVDITSLQSAHRIVFKSNGGNDTIVGTLRDQDVIELAAGLTVEDYAKTVNSDGTTTLTSDGHSITYASDGDPILKEHDEEQDDDEDDDNQSGTDKPVVTGERFTVKKGDVLQLTTAQLLANDLDTDGGELSIVELDEDEHGTAVLNEDGTITFTPKAGFTGEASFTYMVSDGQGGYSEGTVSITVEKPAPVAGIPAPIATNPEPVVEEPQPMSLTGGRGNDRLVGEAAKDQIKGGNGHDHMDGGAGADRMWGGRGNDTYIVDDRGDRVYESKNQGTDTVKASVSYSLSGTHVEKLVLTGTSDLNGTGNGLNNSLIGNSGDNVLKGGSGHDKLKGMSGDDKLYGGDGNDRLEGGRDDDRLYGGKGEDRLYGGSGDDRLDGSAVSRGSAPWRI
ncbi:MAG: hypothetical protein K0Q80_2808, partial [Microvirga sp.]|nr:hypothetical protein [Microvirga sp.]